MKVLVVHNAYQHKGGEDSVMEAEVALLESRGHTVELFLRHNDTLKDVPVAIATAQTFWSSSVAREFEQHLQKFQPDVVHVHNTFPLISPAIYWVAQRLCVPVVQTLHNFRLLCPQATFLRSGKVCEDCLGKTPWHGAARGCYRGSVLQSTVLASMLMTHRAAGTWENKVTRYVALNAFCRDKFVAGGLPATRIAIKPNFVDFAAPIASTRSGFLFVGRLSVEKGLNVLVDACGLLAAACVKVAGDGPEAKLLEDAKSVKALGVLSGDQVRHEMSRTMALVLPSVCLESFPRTLVEAFGCGLPVIASRIGALAELIKDGETGLLFNPGDPQDLAEKMQWAMAHQGRMAAMGRNARLTYEAEYTADRNYQQLIAIYSDAIAAMTPPIAPMPMADRITKPVLKAKIDAVSWNNALERIATWAGNHESRYVCICNSHSVVTTTLDPAFKRVVQMADMATPDGAPVAWMMRRLGAVDQQRINGPDLMWRYLTDAAKRGESIYLYGGQAHTLTILQERLTAAFPGLRIAGMNSPPYRALTSEEDENDVKRINASGAGTVWVSLGCPKQELWMAAHRGSINAVMIGVGAAFDYHAGTTKRAPVWMQNAGLEWLHRLGSEPRRLWKRYLVTNTLFMLGAAKQLIFQRGKRSID